VGDDTPHEVGSSKCRKNPWALVKSILVLVVGLRSTIQPFSKETRGGLYPFIMGRITIEADNG
jgi:hypothetical protein